MIGGDGRRTDQDIEQWLKLVEDAEPHIEPPLVLFLLDLCHSGGPARLNWQQVMRVNLRRTWVIAAAEPGKPAYNGWLSQAVAEVLEEFQNDTLRVDPSLQHIPISRFCREVAKRVERYVAEGSGVEQLVQTPLTPAGTDLSHLTFFPNPRYVAGETGEEAQEGEASSPAPELVDLLDEAVDFRHFTGRGSGAEPVFGRVGPGFFRGREAEAAQLADWLRGKGTALRVVTGKPGVGKSALLGVLVCAAHPAMRPHTIELWRRRLADPPPAVTDLAVVHARRRSVTDVLAAMARQWGLATVAGETAEEVAAVLGNREAPPTLVIDAVDEAQDPQELMTVLLTLIDARRTDGRPVCRLLVGVRPERRFGPLLRRARRARGRLDLGRVPRGRLREELYAYVRELLAATETYGVAASEGLAEELARGISGALTRRRRAEVGEFLAAALYVRHVLDRSVPESAIAARRLGAAVPRDLRELMELDLSQRLDAPWLRPVLTTLAFAQGSGMPEEVIHAAVGAFRPRGLGEDTSSMDDVRSALEGGRFYLRRDVDREGYTRYRLFHQGLADQLRTATGAGAIWPRLLAHSERWSTAQPYLLEYAAHHAAEAGLLEELLEDCEFLVHADARSLESLLASFYRVRKRRDDREPQQTAELYVWSAAAHRDRHPGERRQLLAVVAAQAGLVELAAALTGARPWRPRKIGTVPKGYWEAPRSLDGDIGLLQGGGSKHVQVNGIAAVDLGGRPLVISVAGDDLVRFWDVREGREIGGPSRSGGLLNGGVLCCGTSDGDLVVLADGPFRELNLWKVRNPEQALDKRKPVDFTFHVDESFSGERERIEDIVCTSVQDRPIAVSGGSRRTGRGLPAAGVVRCWDLRDLTEWGEPLLGHRGAVRAVAAVTIGGHPHAVTGGEDGTVRLWDLETGTGVTITGHSGPVRTLTTLVLSGRPCAVTGGDDGTVQVLDLETSTRVNTFTGHEGRVRHIIPAMLQDRPHAVTGGDDGTVRLWDLEAGSEADTMWLPGKPRGLTVTTDGSIVVALDATIIALESGSPLPQIRPIDPLLFP
ncbi:hypothetical protein ACIBBB_33250 [Streptomyces sp. NPDC051217]|uniref:hypothetical protein n=1 Tax=Streptomyces sp. NPDC051217 TaxID=3365644 RepID=UPI0037AA8FB8